ncbi:hypothetical protein TW95_gp1653 [Pandoravirus inopinatum]|uniref:Transmembrane protein n=1 Tax=Pandoravirus inopinatum TaxID=1605721 RepID=A0A0B5JEZ0_9VIRU|nr:hypothetical protein TW95_gp1653 [Pandoravirus inopinatum]AJF98387.1 hypothetical protein [Pandoravirus inopinatum]
MPTTVAAPAALSLAFRVDALCLRCCRPCRHCCCHSCNGGLRACDVGRPFFACLFLLLALATRLPGDPFFLCAPPAFCSGDDVGLPRAHTHVDHPRGSSGLIVPPASPLSSPTFLLGSFFSPFIGCRVQASHKKKKKEKGYGLRSRAERERTKGEDTGRQPSFGRLFSSLARQNPDAFLFFSALFLPLFVVGFRFADAAAQRGLAGPMLDPSPPLSAAKGSWCQTSHAKANKHPKSKRTALPDCTSSPSTDGG